MNKPSAAHAKVLRGMFPSSSGSKKRTSTAFDPTDDCVFLDQKRKKKAARSKMTKISIFVLEDHSRGVPRGAARKRMIDNHRVVKVDIQRNMSPKQVKSLILREIEHLDIDTYTILECVGSRLIEAVNQMPNGDDLIEDAVKRKGAVVYICDVPPPEEEYEETREEKERIGSPPLIDLTQAGPSGTSPTSSPVHSKRPYSPPSPASSDDLPKVFSASASVDTTEGGDNLAEYRRIRKEQDAEFAESLKVDREKSKRNQETIRRQQKCQSLQSILKTKFVEQDTADGVKVSFKFANSVHLEYAFSPKELTKTLYEFVLSSKQAGSCFSLFTTQPRRLVPPSDTCTLEQCSINVPTVIVVEESEQDILEYLSSSVAVRVNDVEVVQIPAVREVLERATEDRMNYVISLNMHPAITHIIDRSNLYNDVLGLFNNASVLEHYPLQIKFLDEMAIDHGGVSRDMLSGFWEEAYRHQFDGSALLVPVVHAQTDMSVFSTLGRILSHGYLLEGFLPVRIAFPTLAAMLLGPNVQLPDDIVTQSFADSLDSVEASLIKFCLTISSKSFPVGVQSKLISLFSRFGSRQLPTPLNLRQQIKQVAHYQFIVKPAAALSMVHSGIPVAEQPFWKQRTVDDLRSLFMCLTATPSKVLEVLDEPDFVHSAQERVYGYLRQFIGNMKMDEVRNFLRFVTGSSVLSNAAIKVTFNALGGLARRPIAHTCDNSVELSTEYLTYVDFTAEFEAILSDTVYSWSMDIV